MAALRHTVQVEHPLLRELIQKTMADGLSQDELNAAYDDICQNYDELDKVDGYVAPNIAALALAKVFSEKERGQKIILDIGAGTGQVAEEMHKIGFKTFDAVEPSQGMLKIAKEKRLYRNFFCEAVGKEQLNIPAASYDIVTVVGCLLASHIKSDALHEMIRLTKPGGVICIVARRESLEDLEEYKDFFPLCDELEQAGRWQKIESSACPYSKNKDDIILLHGTQVLYKVL